MQAFLREHRIGQLQNLFQGTPEQESSKNLIRPTILSEILPQ